jgi:hypothetical protein
MLIPHGKGQSVSMPLAKLIDHQNIVSEDTSLMKCIEPEKIFEDNKFLLHSADS